jgi:hypothetical protein
MKNIVNNRAFKSEDIFPETVHRLRRLGLSARYLGELFGIHEETIRYKQRQIIDPMRDKVRRRHKTKKEKGNIEFLHKRKLYMREKRKNNGKDKGYKRDPITGIFVKGNHKRPEKEIFTDTGGISVSRIDRKRGQP